MDRQQDCLKEFVKFGFEVWHSFGTKISRKEEEKRRGKREEEEKRYEKEKQKEEKEVRRGKEERE